MPDKSFADLLAEAGIQPSAATQYAQSLQRPVPYRNYTPPRPMPRTMRPPEARMFDQNPGVQQQAAAQIRRQNAVGQDAMLREAQGPANNQFADAGMVALETTGIPAIRRSYDAFEAGKPREGIYEGIWGGLGLAGTLGAIPGRGRVPRSPMREPVLPTMREASAPPPGSVLPVRPRQPFRQSLIGGSDDLSGASRGVFSEGPPDGMPRPAPDAGPSGGSSARVEGVAPNQRRVMVTDRSGEEYGFEVLEGNTAVRLRQPYLPKRARRQGLGVAAYEAAIAYAEAQGKTFISDTAVSPAARHVYDALERRGYRVERHNPEALRDSNLGRDLPDYYGNDQGGAPLFTVRGRTPTPPPSAASGGETLGAIPGARRAPRAPMREPVLPQMREAPTPLPSNVLPVRPPQPFRQSLIGGADDLTGASRGVFSEGPADGMPTRAPDAGSGDAGQTAGQRPQRFTQTSDDPYSREYEVQIDDGAMARVRIQRSDAGDDVQWDIEALQDGGVPATGARRNMLGLSAMRGVREVLAHDAQAYRPQRYTFEAASDMSGDTSARTGLYRSMIERDAASFGYVPSQDGQFFGLERRAPDAPTAGPSRPPPDTAKSYRPGPAKAGLFFSRRR